MELKLPELGEGVHEGELVKWCVKVGDMVKDDQPICEIMTDKATVELPAPFTGKITSLAAKEGEVVHVGQVMVTYEGAGSSVSPTASGAKSADALAKSESKPASAPAHSAQAAMSAAPSASSSPTVSAGPGMSVAAAPSTRKFAREQGVDLSHVSPTGPNGRVMREDVESAMKGGNGVGATSAGRATFSQTAAGSQSAAGFAKTSIASGPREERVPFKGLRKKIAEKMRQSKDHAAHFTYVEECDATELVKLRAAAKDMGAKDGIKVTYLPFIMKAMVATLRQYPIMNTSLDEERNELVYKNYFNIALSVQTDDGLTAPVIKDVDQKSIMQLAKEIQDVVDRARHKKLTMEDLTGGTITLTNAGSIGGLFATPVINYPEVAILGFNKIDRKPVVKVVNGQEQIVIRDWTLFSISLDHRVVDGAIGAEFMKSFIRIIENPALLVLGA